MRTCYLCDHVSNLSRNFGHVQVASILFPLVLLDSVTTYELRKLQCKLKLSQIRPSSLFEYRANARSQRHTALA
ncbi:hypothetical protein L596_001559 [Steinernema carpocapsae]|uniref:Uncharacterized protein n=1 Tax=Steinernema carpocapsae TaxID=34508 RepID=A0A4U8UML3_STECR|nr:hypothetical protein L596_001559 [Steinernema carpocapsae]